MPRDRSRVLVLALVALGAIVTSCWLLDWYRLEALGTDVGGLDLPSASGPGVWGKLSTLTLWGSVAFGVLVALQAGARLTSGFASAQLSRSGYLVGVLVFVIAVMTAFFFQPEYVRVLNVGIQIQRTYAPAILFVGLLAGVFALYYAQLQDTQVLAPLAPPRVPEARVVPASGEPAEPELPAKPRTRSRPLTNAPEPLRYKLAFATVTAEVTRGGIDARREDDSSVLVVWRDVVGVVVRRLPPMHGGVATDATFVDVVSTAGATLRILPWTRLTGEPLPGDNPERARAVVELVVAHCPNVHIDRATRDFLERRGPAAQLPDDATLAAHDERLA